MRDYHCYRIYLTWSNLDTGLGRNKCSTGKRNQFVVGFEEVKLDSAGQIVEWDESYVYSRHHTKERLKEAKETENDTLTALVESPDGELEVKAVMGPDCQATIDIQVLGKHRAEMDM